MTRKVGQRDRLAGDPFFLPRPRMRLLSLPIDAWFCLEFADQNILQHMLSSHPTGSSLRLGDCIRLFSDPTADPVQKY